MTPASNDRCVLEVLPVHGRNRVISMPYVVSFPNPDKSAAFER
jgi:hypothetical protein